MERIKNSLENIQYFLKQFTPDSCEEIWKEAIQIYLFCCYEKICFNYIDEERNLESFFCEEFFSYRKRLENKEIDLVRAKDNIYGLLRFHNYIENLTICKKIIYLIIILFRKIYVKWIRGYWK